MFCTYTEGQIISGIGTVNLGYLLPLGTTVETEHVKYILAGRNFWRQVGERYINYFKGSNGSSLLIRYIPTSRVLHIGKIV